MPWLCAWLYVAVTQGYHSLKYNMELCIIKIELMHNLFLELTKQFILSICNSR